MERTGLGNHQTNGDADQRAKLVAGFYRPSTAAADRIEGLKANLTGMDREADWLRETLKGRW